RPGRQLEAPAARQPARQTGAVARHRPQRDRQGALARARHRPERADREGRQPLRHDARAARLRPARRTRAAQEGGLQGRGDRYRDDRRLHGQRQADVRGDPRHVARRRHQRQGRGGRVLRPRPEEPGQELQGPVVVGPDLDARRSGRHDVAPPLVGRAAGPPHPMRGVLLFLAPRLLRALIAVWLVSTVVFVVMRLSGDPVPLLLPPDAPRSEIFRVRRELGLDRTLPVQYGVFLVNALRGDFGRSIHFREPAFAVVRGYLGATAELGLTAFLLAAFVAVPVGLLSAVKRNSAIDHIAMGVALVGQSAPTFFLGILFILLLSLKADLFPTGGRGDWTHLALPALTLGAFAMASIARLTRSAVLEVLRADYIRTARAKGVAEWRVVVKHTLKNAALPIVTITGLQLGTLLGGAVVTETVFAWPGIGRLAIQSIYNRDYPIVQCAVFLSVIVFIVI